MQYIKLPLDATPIIADLSSGKVYYLEGQSEIVTSDIQKSILDAFKDLPDSPTFILAIVHNGNVYLVDALNEFMLSENQSYIERLASVSNAKIMPLLISPHILFSEDAYGMRISDNLSPIDDKQYSIHSIDLWNGKLDIHPIQDNIYKEIIEEYIWGDKSDRHEVSS